LKVIHPDYLFRALTTKQFREWIAYYYIEPFGEWRADIRQAITSMIIANVNRSKNQRAFRYTDFMPFEKPKKRKRQTQKEMIAQLNLLT